jgi:hypothetical protein
VFRSGRLHVVMTGSVMSLRAALMMEELAYLIYRSPKANPRCLRGSFRYPAFRMFAPLADVICKRLNRSIDTDAQVRRCAARHSPCAGHFHVRPHEKPPCASSVSDV